DERSRGGELGDEAALLAPLAGEAEVAHLIGPIALPAGGGDDAVVLAVVGAAAEYVRDGGVRLRDLGRGLVPPGHHATADPARLVAALEEVVKTLPVDLLPDRAAHLYAVEREQ